MSDEIDIGQDDELIDEEKKRLMGEYGLDVEGVERLENMIGETGMNEDDAADLLGAF